jgi:hypothetical protein
LASTSRGSASSRSCAWTRRTVEQLDERLVDVLARALQARLERPVALEHLGVEAVEELRVAGLVDLLGGQERLLGLVVVGAHEAAELVATRSSPMKNADRL